MKRTKENLYKAFIMEAATPTEKVKQMKRIFKELNNRRLMYVIALNNALSTGIFAGKPPEFWQEVLNLEPLQK